VLVAVAKTLWVILFPLRPLLRPLLRYLVGVRQEFREVVWPKRREAWKLTFAVVAFALVFVLLVQVIDYGVRQVFEKVII
jgi:preprotein translocase SecE subunit